MRRTSFVFALTILITVVPAQVFGGLNYSATDLGKIVVTATRIGQLDYKLADNVTVITQEQIEDSNAHNVAELLTQATGVNVYDYGTTKSAIIDIRGFGETAPSNVLVLVNDHKINSVDLSGPDLARIPIDSIERVEIIRGAGSVLYGDNAVGGVVNIITKEGEGDLSGRAGILYESFGSKGADVEASGERNNISYYLYSKYFDKHGYRDNSDVLAKDFNTRLGYDFMERLKTDFNIMWHDDHFGLPFGLTDSDLKTLGPRATTSPDSFVKTTDRSFNWTLDVNPWPEDMYFGKLVFDILYRNRDVYETFFAGSAANRRIDTTGVSGKYVFDRTIFSKEVNFVTGFDLYDNRNPIRGEDSDTTDIIIKKKETGAYGFFEYELFPHMFLNGGSRYQQAKYIFDDRQFSTYNTKKPHEWVSTGGAKYEYAPGSSIHASFQETFRFPVTDEFYSTFTGSLNSGLKEQTGEQYEVGIKHNFNDTVVAHLTPYYMKFKDEIFFNPQNFTNSNIDGTRRVGVEVGQEADLLKFIDIHFLNKLKFIANYNFQDPKITDGPFKDKEVPFVPEHQANAGLSATFLKHYNLSFNSRYVGSRYKISDFANASNRMKPYYLLDTKIAYERKNWDVYMSIDNLTDYRYIGVTIFTGSNYHYPSPGRMFTFGTNIKF